MPRDRYHLVETDTLVAKCAKARVEQELSEQAPPVQGGGPPDAPSRQLSLSDLRRCAVELAAITKHLWQEAVRESVEGRWPSAMTGRSDGAPAIGTEVVVRARALVMQSRMIIREVERAMSGQPLHNSGDEVCALVQPADVMRRCPYAGARHTAAGPNMASHHRPRRCRRRGAGRANGVAAPQPHTMPLPRLLL